MGICDNPIHEVFRRGTTPVLPNFGHCTPVKWSHHCQRAFMTAFHIAGHSADSCESEDRWG
jgi:hypothetical protein